MSRTRRMIESMMTPFPIRIATVLLLLGSLAPGASAQSAGESALRPAALEPGDALEIRIWRETDLSGNFIVDEEGTVTLPMLGRVQVRGVPVAELRADLMARYQVELRNPSILITPLRRIYVLGEVNNPGLFAMDFTLNLAGAIAMAGGAAPQGDLSRLRIMRDGAVLHHQIHPGVDLSAIGVRSGDQIFVDRRGWLDRNSAFMISATLGMAGIIVTVLR